MNLILKKYIWIVLLAVWCLTTNGQVIINEILSSNITVTKDPQYSEYSDWIELYNSGDQDIDLSGYALSDDPANIGKWQFPEGTLIPAKEYLLLWADGRGTGLHTNFRLNSDGEQVILTDTEGLIADSVTYGEQAVDVSYGRDPENNTEWLYFSTPSPNAVNNTRSHAGIVGKPVLSLTGGFYSGPQTIVCSISLPGSFIRYTLDGSEPSMSSPVYNSPIVIDSTTILRIKGYCEGYLSGKIVTSTYFVDEGNFTLPVISISAAPEDLWDDDIGIYVEGNADCDCGMNLTGNYCCEDWEKPIGIEMYETDGTQAFSINAGLKIFGSGSRKRIPQRSLSIFARGRYGFSEIDCQLFPDKPINEFKSVILRSSAHDWIKTMFRDALIQYLSVGYMDLDFQAYRPSVVFINGSYWGIHNIREKLNEDYLASNHGVDPDNVDILERNSWIVEGDNIAYNQLIDFVSSHDMSIQENYDYAKSRIDVREYMDYLILHIYSSKSDWPSNNIKFWRPRTAEGKWRWLVYDMDFGFGLDTERFHEGTYEHNMMALVTDPDGDTWNNPPWSTLLIRKMLDNPGFRNEFIQRFCHHLNTTFEPQRVLDMINQFKAAIEDEIPRHIERWGGSYALQLGYVFESPEEWDENIDVMREFAVKRPPVMRQHLAEVFGLEETVKLLASKSEPGGGSVIIEDIPMHDSLFSGTYFKDIPVRMKAVENMGYEFGGWTITSTVPETDILMEKGAEWKYLDDGSNQGTTWRDRGFDDSGWKSGHAQLGYGDEDENTVVSYGSNSNDKYITTYFRKEFLVEEDNSYNKLIFSLMRDDGAVIYLNGQEIIRSNMPDGTIDYQTTASRSVPAVSENIYLTFEVSGDYLIPGNNMLAVEIHQYAGTSSDISFDMSLLAEGAITVDTVTYAEPELLLGMEGDYQVEAVFNKLPEFLFINEFMADNSFAFTDEYGEYDDWIEIYNAGHTDIDLAGYFVTDSLNQPDKWQIPDGFADLTTVPAGESLVLWADNDTEQGPLHLGFKLRASGEQIGLSFDGINYIDSLSYRLQIEDRSFGRYPDGSGSWQSFAYYSPGEFNRTGTKELTLEGNRVKVYPNPATNHVNISLHTFSPEMVQFSLIDITGRTVFRENYHVQGDYRSSFDLSPYPGGIYIALFKFKDEVKSLKILYYK